MPRAGTMAQDIVDYLTRVRRSASVAEISEALTKVRRSPVLRHSVRSALYQHLDESGGGLFVRVERGHYALHK
jgi:hypothetical protein